MVNPVQAKVAEQNLKTAEDFKQTKYKDAEDFAERSAKEMEKFNEKLARFSSWILSVSLTVFLAMYGQTESLQTNSKLFFALWILLIISVCAFISTKYFYSFYLIRECWSSHWKWEIMYRNTVLENKNWLNILDNVTIQPVWDKFFEQAKTKVEDTKSELKKIQKSAKGYFIAFERSSKISTLSFVSWIIVLVILLWNLSSISKEKSILQSSTITTWNNITLTWN